MKVPAENADDQASVGPERTERGGWPPPRREPALVRRGRIPAPRAAGYDHSVAQQVERHLRTFFADQRAAHRSAPVFTDSVVDRLERFTLDGGKRLRPLFAWWGWRAAGGAGHGRSALVALRAAAALELVQACALIHDDVMDASALRRGRPAVHVAFADEHRAGGYAGDPDRYGESLAVLAGDLALVWADDLLSDALGERSLRRVREPWTRLRTEMMAGQFLDVHAQACGDDSEPAALRVARLKTAAYSVERPLHFGAALADAPSALVERLRHYGTGVGTAFQIRDDLLGVYGDSSVTGKPVGDDLREGKRTLVMAIGLRRARERGDTRAHERLTGALGDPGLTPGDVGRVRSDLDGLGARAAAEEHMDRLVRRAVRAIEDPAVAEPARDALRDLARHAVHRDY